ncbi:MAG: NAD(P)/FAD-dependent oxidoreductase [Kiloniellales bacterium]|nr:NAD(P)/FAD-dependent oxidoreductase [Kiloniellales bacterium]
MDSARTQAAAAIAEPPAIVCNTVRWSQVLKGLSLMTIWPLLDLAIRLWFGFRLFPVDMMMPVGPLLGLLLAFGFLTQPVAAVTIWYCVTAAIGFAGHAAEIALLVWLTVAGASYISLDWAFAAGARSIALPGVDRVSGWGRRLAELGEPVLLLLMRLLAALILLAILGSDLGGWRFFLLSGWRIEIGPAALQGLIYVVAALLALGFLTRVAALAAGLTLLALGGLAAAGPILLLAVLAFRGGGRLTLDGWIAGRVAARYPHLFAPPDWDDSRLPHVVIVGAGFGGLAAAKAFRQSPCRVTLIDRRNYHLFQPLLYQVATAGLSPADIAMPVRAVFRDQANVRVLLGRVTGVDRAARRVLIGEREVPYDYLILATGARHSYFGKDAWEPLAPGLKKIDDATSIRRRILLAFERAEDCDDPEERAAWLTFVVIGGGPTGVEIAGALVELAHHGMAGDFRRADPTRARVILVEGGPRPLGAFTESLSEYSRRALEDLGVEVRVGTRVEEIDETGVVAGGERIAARTVVWGAGVIASAAHKWLGAEHDRAGRVVVGPDLSVPGAPEVFVIGDTCLSTAWNGDPVPGLAPAAKQGGAYVARVIHNRIVGRAAPPPFRYQHQGSLATIGRQAAVVDFGRFRLKGALAWWFWGLVHVFFLIGTRNRMSVMLEWFWAYLTFRRGTRLITGSEG